MKTGGRLDPSTKLGASPSTKLGASKLDASRLDPSTSLGASPTTKLGASPSTKLGARSARRAILKDRFTGRASKLGAPLLDKLGAPLLDKLGCTPNEKKVIVFLLIMLCAGAGIRIFGAASHSRPAPAPDYSALENEFSAKSKASIDSARRTATAASGSHGESSIRPGKKKTPPECFVDLNTATRESLMALPGIGESTARSILLYREEHGSFSSNEELLNVRGIGPKKYLKLKPYLREP